MKKLALIIFTSALLTACAGGGGLNSAFSGGSSETTAFDTAAAFKGANKVVIGAFTVGFDVKKTDSVKAGGGLLGNGFGGKSTAHSTLTGVSDATMQEIADKAYSDFVTELKSKGYTVVDRSTLLNAKEFAKTKSYPNPYEDTQGGLLGGGNTTKYFAPSSFKEGVKIFLGNIPGVTGGIGFSNPGTGAGIFANNTGIPVISAFYKVDFANSEKYGGWHTQSSSVSVGQGITISPDRTKIGIIGGQGGSFSKEIGSITLKKPISSDKKFAEIIDSTSGTYETVQTITNVVGVIGGIGSNRSKNYTFKANPSAYKSASINALNETNDLLVSKIRSVR